MIGNIVGCILGAKSAIYFALFYLVDKPPIIKIDDQNDFLFARCRPEKKNSYRRNILTLEFLNVFYRLRPVIAEIISMHTTHRNIMDYCKSISVSVYYLRCHRSNRRLYRPIRVISILSYVKECSFLCTHIIVTAISHLQQLNGIYFFC